MSIPIRPLLTLFFLLFIFSGIAQTYTLSGRVVDAASNEPLAFVSLLVNSSQQAHSTDIDGKFNLKSREIIRNVRVSYVGYETVDIPVADNAKNLTIRLTPISIEIEGVVILPGINPAHRIILNAVANRKINDPRKLKSFSYTSYDKIIFTTNLDTLNKLDSLSQDTSLNKIKEFFGNQDIAMIENVVERKFKSPESNAEKVIATRISGFKDPIFVFLISQLQSTSFYTDLITIFDKNYINPISTGSIYKYFFQLEDTMYGPASGDTSFILSYRPLKNKNFDGLKGTLCIHSDRWAIRNVIATPADEQPGIDIKIQQLYEKVDGRHWFPVQLNNEISFKNIELQAGKHKFYAIGKGKSYLRNIQIDPEIPASAFSEVALYVDPMASKRPESFWNLFRQDSLSKREIRTYAFLDSVGQAENFDRMARSFETMLTGKIPFHFVDFDMTRLLRYNAYEKIYAGLGIWTNDKISRRFRVGTYAGYGFGDSHWKYGTELDLILNRKHEVELKLGYKNDIAESGGLSLFGDYKIAAYDRLRNFFITKMHYEEVKYIGLSFRTLRYLTLNTGMMLSDKKAAFPYEYLPSSSHSSVRTGIFRYTDFLLGFRYAFREKFMENARTRISMGTTWPVLYMQWKHGFNQLAGGQYKYNHLDIKINKSFYIKYLGKTSVTVQAGFIDRAVPYTELFVAPASYRQFTIYAPNSFAGMRMNEFVSDRYAAVFFTHDFGSLLLKTKNFDPHFALATNFGIGKLAHPEHHRLVGTDDMRHGYYESGLIINKLLNINFYSLGIGAFYRYGAYAFPEWQENVSLKISMVLPF